MSPALQFLELLPRHDLEEGQAQDFGVEKDRVVTKIVEVQVQAGEHFLQGVRIAVVQGGIAGYARTDLGQVLVARIALHDLVNIILTFRTVADERHVSPEYVVKLRPFVQVMLAEEFAHLGEPGIVVPGIQRRAAAGLGVGPHGPKLEDLERLSSPSDAFLPVNDRFPVLDPDGKGADAEERGEDQQQARQDHVEGPLQGVSGAGHAIGLGDVRGGIGGVLAHPGLREEDAVYAGYTASGNASLQFNDDNKAGIVTTTSGGKVRKVTALWNSSTANARSLAIYVSHTPYKSADDLYDKSTQGELQGYLTMGWPQTTFLIDGDWEYVGLRSYDKTLYITEIDVAWEEDE